VAVLSMTRRPFKGPTGIGIVSREVVEEEEEESAGERAGVCVCVCVCMGGQVGGGGHTIPLLQ